MQLGVFIPIGNNGWLISTTSPQYKPSFDLNKTVVQKAEALAEQPLFCKFPRGVSFGSIAQASMVR